MNSSKRELLAHLRRNDLLRAVLVPGIVADANFFLEMYAEKILELSAAVWQRVRATPNDPIVVAESINQVLFREYGILGKTARPKNRIDEPELHYVHALLERRYGSAIAITSLYAAIASQMNVPFTCVLLPTQFLLRFDDAVRPFYVEPYDDGKLLPEEEVQRRVRNVMARGKLLSSSLYEVAGPTQLVARILTQLKQAYLLKGRALEALRSIDLLTTIYPNSPELARDRGVLYCEMEYFSQAERDLRAYLKERPTADDVAEIKKLASMLKGCREIVN